MNKMLVEGFDELSVNEMCVVDGGGLIAIIVGGVVSYIMYEGANAICEDFTGKTIGKHIADAVFPAN